MSGAKEINSKYHQITPMLLFTLIRKASGLYSLLLIVSLLTCVTVSAQTTSWKGTSSTDWNTAANWTAGVPTATTEAIVGDANFSGANQPTINTSVTVVMGALTLGGGTKIVTLTINNDQDVTVNGNIAITSNATMHNFGSSLRIGGDFINNGSYTEGIYKRNGGSGGAIFPEVIFSGTGKAIGGTAVTTFSIMTVTGSLSLTSSIKIKALTLPDGVHSSTTLSAGLTVNDVFDPGLNMVTWEVNSGYVGTFVVAAGGTIKVKATTFGGNYGLWPTTMYVNSTIDYAAANGSQTVSDQGVYGILRISGGGIKSLAGNTTVSAISAVTQLIVDAGTLDIGPYTLDRTNGSVVGGTLTVANGAILKIGGTGTFPTGYDVRNLGSTSTVEYDGTAQTVSNEKYGNLTLSGSGIKTMPAAAMTVAGNLTSRGAASFTAGSSITVNNNTDIGSGTTFNGGGATITAGGDWTNNGTFAGNISTVVLNGSGKQIIRTAAGTASFNNLSITGGAINIAAPDVTVSGNLTTTGNGALSQSSGQLTMNGNSKVITGAGISLNDLTIDGSITSDASFTVTGNLAVNSGKSFAASAGTILMNGAGKAINATGTLAFSGLRVLGTISTGSNFKIDGNLSGTGMLTATAGTVTFGGASTFGGTHNLFNVTVASGKSLAMVTNAKMGIAGAFIVSGTVDVTTNMPNTITYNGAAGQMVLGRTYNNIVFDKAGTKTAGGALTVNGNLTINAGSGFNAAGYSHTLEGNWINNGAFTAAASTVAFTGTSDATVTGATTFNVLTLNKDAATSNLAITSNVTTSILNLTTGWLRTRANRIIVTSGRSGTGWVIGTIERSHSFTSGTAYAFAGPYNTISFTNATGITSVTVTNTIGIVSSFANGNAINRRYDVSIAPAGTYAGTIQLQYHEADLNGNSEAGLQLYNAPASSGPWSAKGETARDATQNWVSNGTLSDVSGSWTLSETTSIVRWNGSINTDWLTAGNWTEAGSGASKIPGALDIVEFGFVPNVPNQPVLQTTQTVKAIQFTGAGTPISLSLNGGALTVSGNVAASGNSSATVAHSININAGALNVGGSLTLYGGGTGNNINLSITTGSATVTGDLNHAGSSTIALGSGNFKLGGDYNLTAPAANFSAGTGTVTYQGANTQKIGEGYYNNLTIDKSAGIAELNAVQTGAIGGTLTINNGTLSVPGGSYVVTGDIVQNGGTLSIGSSVLEVQKAWTKATGAIFNAGTSMVTFTGGASQSVPAATFNNLTINKSTAATITLAGNVTVHADLNLQSGSMNLGSNTINSSGAGEKFIMGSAATLLLDGSNFPANYHDYMLDKASTVKYQGTGIQNVAATTYGNLWLQNGAANAKKLQGPTRVNGDLTVSSGATFSGEGQTLTLSGNFYQKGTFLPGPVYTDGTLVLTTNGGVQKLLSGTIEVNNFLLETGADYQLTNGNMMVNGDYTNQGSFDGTLQTMSVSGNFLNTGALKSSGVAVFTGMRLQTIQLQAPIIPGAAGPPAMELNGSIAPVLNSTAAPDLGNVIIRNTDPAGIRASVGWTMRLKFDVQSGAKFDGGPYTHNFYTAISNAGTIVSAGTLNFSPSGLAGLAAYPLNFGTTANSFQSTGTLRIGGTELVALAGVVPASLNNLVITNTNAAGVSTQKISDDLPLYGTVWNLTGNLSIGSGAIFNAAAVTSYTIGGNLVDNGTLNGAGGAFTLTNAAGLANNPVTVATIDGPGTTTLGSLTIDAGASVKINKGISISGDLTYKGISLSAGGVEINFTGTGPSVIAAAGGTLSLGNIKVSKSAPETAVTLQAAITDVEMLNVTGGTLDLGAYTMSGIAMDQSGTQGAPSTLTVANGAFLKIGGTGTIPQLSVFDLGETSTVTYYGSNQEVESTQYGHLKTLNTGTKIFKLGTAKIAGDFTKAAEATVVPPETIEYNGAAAQAVAAINYNNLILSNGGDKTFATGTAGIANALTVTGNASIKAAASGLTVDYNGALAQDVLPTSYFNLRLSNGGIKRFLGTTGIAAGFTLADAATADLATNENTIDFNGAAAQAVPALNYKNLNVSGTGIKTLQGNATVEKQLALTAGELQTGNYKIILSQAEGAISETETAYVTGTVETTRDVASGIEQSFGGLGLTITPSVAAGSTKVTRVTGTAVGVTNNSIKRTFAVAPGANNGSLSATVAIVYFEHELNNNPEEELAFYRSESGANDWQLQPVENTTLDAAANRVSITGFNKFSSVTLGSINSPLPVEIIYFNAAKAGKDAILNWATATEQDNEGFAVEVSADGYAYRQLGFVKSVSGNAAQMQKYSFTDTENGKTGLRYYRLRQKDTDGKESMYGPKALDFGFIASDAVTAWPNPFNRTLTLTVDATAAGAAKIILHDAVGKQLFVKEQRVAQGK